jgi:hypothetical protein
MSSGPKTRKAIGPTSPRGIYMAAVRAPGKSLDMSDEEPEKKAKGGMLKAAKRKMPKFGPKYGFKKFSSGGSASKRADGCAVKGKTRGKIV